MKKLVFSSFLFIFLFIIPRAALANKIGIHVLDERDFKLANELVNNNHREWGYVTFVIREDERDTARWNRAFKELSDMKLTPIVRIATKMNEGEWTKPSIDEAKNWADFLNSLSWPTSERDVVLFNEPNHAKEWGGEINPTEYAKIARRYWEELKKVNPSFFVLPAALDQSAPNSKDTMNEEEFIKKMYQADNLIFTIFDGWNSHSYPNPAFSGKPTDTGRGTIAGYLWELNFLKNYYLFPNTQVFITETGWALNNEDTVSKYFEYAYKNVWDDNKVAAVTPFILNYTQKPFDKFSWLNGDGTPKKYYETISEL